MVSEKKVFNLVHKEARIRAAAACMEPAFEGWRVCIEPQRKKRAQEEKYHAMIGDIAKQTTYIGRRLGADDMKRILVDEFAEEMRLAGTPLHHDGRLIPSEDGKRVIQLGVQTRDFYVKEAAQFIEFLHAWGAARDVFWSDPLAWRAMHEEVEA